MQSSAGFWPLWWVSGCLDGFLAVSVVFRQFRWFPACFGGFLLLWGNCLAISVIAWPLRPFSAHFGDFGDILAPPCPFLVSSASFWPFLSTSAGFWPLHSSKRHKFNGYTLTTHLLCDPGDTQASRRIFISIGFGAACCCVLLLLLACCCYNLEASLESHHYK